MIPTVNRALALSVALAAVVFAAPQNSFSEEVEAGGVKVEIPAPEGMVRVNGVTGEFDKFLSSGIPTTNELLIVFGSPADLKLLKDGEWPEFTRNFNAQTIVPGMKVSAEMFTELRDVMKNQFDQTIKDLKEEMAELAENVGKTVGEIAEVAVGLEIEQPVPLGMLGNGEGWFSFGMKVPMEVKGAGKKEKVVVTSVVALVNVRGKAVGLYGTQLGEGAEVLESIKRSVWKWKDGVLEANREG